MARQIIVESEGGVTSTFNFSKIDRKKLYGTRRRIPLDPDENPCARAALTQDGSLLIRSGMTAMGYFDDDMRWVPNKELVGLNPGGEPVPLAPSTLGTPQALTGPASPLELLDLQVDVVYALEADEVDPGLKASLEGGDIYSFEFNYRADYRAEHGFLVASGEEIFALVGQPAPPEWCSLETHVPDLDDEEEEADDDLDFEMF